MGAGGGQGQRWSGLINVNSIVGPVSGPPGVRVPVGRDAPDVGLNGAPSRRGQNRPSNDRRDRLSSDERGSSHSIEPAESCLPSAGVYVGDGMLPVPAKLAGRIKRWDYIEMGELLPEFWISMRDGEREGRERKARQSRNVTDHNSWLQCYAIYVAVLGPQEPQALPELMAYMAFIIRVS